MHHIETLNTTVTLYGNSGSYSHYKHKLFVSGAVFHQGKLLTTKDIYHLFQGTGDNPQTIKKLLFQFSGFYTIVYVTQQKLLCAVDKVRSRPLYYCQDTEGKFAVSDDSYSLIGNARETLININVEYEFSRAGYVIGEDTLVSSIKQIQAGEFIVIDNKQRLDKKTYFYFLPKNNNNDDTENQLFERLDKALVESFKELDCIARDRPIVLPLSGGYDSRILAVYLKILGYENVMCFTFGKRSSKEVALSKRIAKSLGFSWHFVQYDKTMWNKIKNSQSFINYLKFICGNVSVANVQVYPAITFLIAQGLIPDNAIVLPGHTGDFTSGGHIPKVLVDKCASEDVEAIVEQIKLRHCKAPSPLMPDSYLDNKLKAQVIDIINSLDQPMTASSIFEAWECRERQAKFIVNSNRYYDFYQLEWWMPLWSNAFIAVWHDIPLSERFNSSIWKRFVEFKYAQAIGQPNNQPLGNAANNCHRATYRLKKIFDYFTDENDLYALVPFYRWVFRKLKYPYSKGTVFSYLSHKIIRMIKEDSNKQQQ